MFNYLLKTFCGLTILVAAFAAGAQSFPDRPIRFIVTQGPGGTSDLLARAIAKKMSESMGQPVTVDNRAGAEGIIGMEAGAKAAPDGYTIILTANSVLAMNPSLHKKLPYDSERDYDPVSMVGPVTYGLFVHPSVPANNLREFIQLAKSKPGSLNYGSGGATARLATEMLKAATDIDITHVPYKSNPAALNDLIAGQVQAMFFPMLAAPYVKTGQLKLLAVSSPRRSALLPSAPTFAESGVSGMAFSAWASIHTPAGVPKDRLERLNTEVVKALATTEVIELGRSLGFEPESSSREQLAVQTKREIGMFAKFIKDSRLNLE